MNAFAEFPDLIFSVFKQSPDTVATCVRELLAKMPLQIQAAKLDLRFAYNARPKYPSQTGWTPAQFLFWSPSNALNWTVMMCNSPCGRQPFIKLIAEHLNARSYFARDCQDVGHTYLDRYEQGEEPRHLAVYKEDERWRFTAIGPAQRYEDFRKYEKKDIAKRLTRQVISDYLGTEGLDLASDEFWQSDESALILWDDQDGRRSKPGRDGVDKGGTRSGWKPEYDSPRSGKTYIYHKVDGVFERKEADNFKELKER